MAGDDFLSRWSRRKRDVNQGEEPQAAATAPQPEEMAQPGGTIDAAPSAETLGDTLSDEDLAALPSPDALTVETDLTQFLRSGVPQTIRNAALRRMWSIDPGIRDYLSEAREYAFDWHIPGAVPGTGPMLPTDDIADMVRDVFEGTKPPAIELPPSERIEVGEQPGAGSPVAAEHDQDVRTQLLASGEPPSPDTESARMIAQQTEAEPVREAVEIAPAGRVRRHGGASPI